MTEDRASEEKTREVEVSLRIAYAFKAVLNQGFTISLNVAEFYKRELNMKPKTALNTAKTLLDFLTGEGFFTMVAESKPTVYTLTPFGAAFILIAVRSGFTRVVKEEEVLTFLARRSEELVPYVDAIRFLRSHGLKSSLESEEPGEDLAFFLALIKKKEEAIEDVLEAVVAEDLKRMKEEVRDWIDLTSFIIHPLADFLEEAEPATVLAVVKTALEEADSMQRIHILEALKLALEWRLEDLEKEKRELEKAIEKMKQYKQAFNL
jgi:hypothetical protein